MNIISDSKQNATHLSFVLNQESYKVLNSLAVVYVLQRIRASAAQWFSSLTLMQRIPGSIPGSKPPNLLPSLLVPILHLTDLSGRCRG